jgi:hypothetical protein
MNIVAKNKDFVSKYHYLWPPLVAILAGYLGVDEFKQRQAAAAAVTVTVETAPVDNSHGHAQMLSTGDVNKLINEAITRRHAKNLELFKQKEIWD